ncbi:hypothetical protein LINPERPRIM_LOCUS8148 [Linum perenne]
MTIVDSSHPFFINPGDHPGLLIVSVPLVGDLNYHSWSRSMTMSLLSKNKLAFVDGTTEDPLATDPLYPVWRRANVIGTHICRSINQI